MSMLSAQKNHSLWTHICGRSAVKPTCPEAPCICSAGGNGLRQDVMGNISNGHTDNDKKIHYNKVE